MCQLRASCPDHGGQPGTQHRPSLSGSFSSCRPQFQHPRETLYPGQLLPSPRSLAYRLGTAPTHLSLSLGHPLATASTCFPRAQALPGDSSHPPPRAHSALPCLFSQRLLLPEASCPWCLSICLLPVPLVTAQSPGCIVGAQYMFGEWMEGVQAGLRTEVGPSTGDWLQQALTADQRTEPGGKGLCLQPGWA